MRFSLAAVLLLGLLLKSCTCNGPTVESRPAIAQPRTADWLASAIREAHPNHETQLDVAFEPFVHDDTEYVLCTFRVLVGEIWKTYHGHFACHLPTRAVKWMPAEAETGR